VQQVLRGIASRRDLVFSLLDQGALSVLNLGFALVLIALATPAEFGIYALVFSSLFIVLSVQNALVVLPLNYLLPGRAAEEQAERAEMLVSVSALITGTTGLGAVAIAFWNGANPVLVLAIAAYMIGNLAREHTRNHLIVTGGMGRALLLDLCFAGASLIMAAVLWKPAGPVAAVLGGIAFGCLAAQFVPHARARFLPQRMMAHLKSYLAFRSDVGWSLAGAMQSEAQLRGYVYVTQFWRGAEGVAVLHAGRTLLSPLLLVANAWARMARPRIVAMLQRGEDGVRRLLLEGVAVVLAAGAAYGVALILFWPIIDTLIFGDKYPDMLPVVVAWWVYAIGSGVEMCLSTALQARRQFRLLAGLGLVSTGMVLAALVGLSFTRLPLVAAVWILLAGVIIEGMPVAYFALRTDATGKAAPETAAAAISLSAK
jgi:O-antigen/teichoic acid export membrane protein